MALSFWIFRRVFWKGSSWKYFHRRDHPLPFRDAIIWEMYIFYPPEGRDEPSVSSDHGAPRWRQPRDNKPGNYLHPSYDNNGVDAGKHSSEAASQVPRETTIKALILRIRLCSITPGLCNDGQGPHHASRVKNCGDENKKDGQAQRTTKSAWMVRISN